MYFITAPIAESILARGGDVGPEGRFLYGVLCWIFALALLEQGGKSLIISLRGPNPLARGRAILRLSGGGALAIILILFRIPAQLFDWLASLW